MKFKADGFISQSGFLDGINGNVYLPISYSDLNYYVYNAVHAKKPTSAANISSFVRIDSVNSLYCYANFGASNTLGIYWKTEGY